MYYKGVKAKGWSRIASALFGAEKETCKKKRKMRARNAMYILQLHAAKGGSRIDLLEILAMETGNGNKIVRILHHGNSRRNY
jgi:hypothetical protein